MRYVNRVKSTKKGHDYMYDTDVISEDGKYPYICAISTKNGGDLFEVNDHGVPTGGLVPKKYLKNGKTPRISVTSKNNGVIGWYEDVDYTGYRTYENCLSVSFMGLM